MWTVIRIAIVLGLLFEVWTHAHWSVALILTLIMVAEEIKTWAMSIRLKNQEAQREFEDKLLKVLQKMGKP